MGLGFSYLMKPHVDINLWACVLLASRCVLSLVDGGVERGLDAGSSDGLHLLVSPPLAIHAC